MLEFYSALIGARMPVLLLVFKDGIAIPCYSNFLATIDKVNQGSFIDSIKKHRDSLSLFCDKLVGSSKKYYNGLPAKAYLDFEEGMKIIDEFFFLVQNQV